jgi:hypothetical protein
MSIIQNSTDSILKTLSFIENQVVPSLDKNKLRFEAYVSLKMKTLEGVQKSIVTLMKQ